MRSTSHGFSPRLGAGYALAAVMLLVAPLVVTGCSQDAPADGLPDEITCSSCHGGEENAAPPASIDSEKSLGAGAHQAHLTGGRVYGPLACESCHIVPETVAAEGHIDPLPAELVWGTLATMADLTPVWDRENATCASTYCHGGSLSGGAHSTPVWTTVDGSQVGCDGCHGYPPPPPHSTSTSCAGCHEDTVNADGTIDIAGGHHINGTIEAAGGCNACHGNEDNAAPPVDLNGSSDTTEVTVGAHQNHLADGTIRKALGCSDCHKVPTSVSAEGHLDESPAELTWGPLATTGDVSPAWDRKAATCATTYCHGATLSGGNVATPVWTTVDGSQKTCDSCHGYPPPAPHPQNENCALCHPGTVLGPNEINVEGGQHIDGELDVAASGCNSCHGNESNAAPPVNLDGSSDTSLVTVGAHQAHLNDGTFRKAVHCQECHTVPTEMDSPGHLGEAPAELTWGPLATGEDAVTPEWNRDTAVCATTYCHGATLSGGTLVDPEWTTLDGSQAQCGTCHGNPPPAPHPDDSDCNACHSDTVTAEGALDLEGGKHIDGTLDVAVNCSSCHGSEANAAPPLDISGSDDTSSVTVGAHQEHLTDGTFRKAIGCNECHIVPTEVGSEGHLDAAPAELVWGELADGGDAVTPEWDRESGSCSNTYCHGATLSGGTLTAPDWTTLDGSQAQCGACHGNPPPAPHPDSPHCRSCHAATIAEDGSIDLEGGKHIDGVLDAPSGLACNSCHGGDDNAAPPADLAGGDDTGSVSVGAHQAHLTDGLFRQAMRCGECHTVPTALDDAGHIDTATPAEVVWDFLADGLATRNTSEPVWDRAAATCSATYCHGNTLEGGSVTTPVWTTVDGTQAACGTCHGIAPPAPHPAVGDNPASCGGCHPETMGSGGQIDIASGTHINGQVEALVLGACDSCHGAPPDTGAHAAHYAATPDTAVYGDTSGPADLIPDGSAPAFGCGNCHPLDASHHANGVWNSGGGRAEVELTPEGAPESSLRSLNPPDAMYTPGGTVLTDAQGFRYTEGTCSNVYCHSRVEVSVPGPVPLPVSSPDEPNEFLFAGYPVEYPPYDVFRTRVYEQPSWGDTLSCDGCHGFPPRTSYDSVEAAAGDSHSWIGPDGEEELHMSPHDSWILGCATCHYDTVTDPGTGELRVPEGGTYVWAFLDPVPIADHTAHVNGSPDVAFPAISIVFPRSLGSDVEHDLSTASYDPATRTCSSVSCHHEQTEVEWGLPYRGPTNTAECNVCHRYKQASGGPPPWRQ